METTTRDERNDKKEEEGGLRIAGVKRKKKITIKAKKLWMWLGSREKQCSINARQDLTRNRRG